MTRCIDDIICPKCGKGFDGAAAVNYQIGSCLVYCPHCKAELNVYTSVEYQAEESDAE